jgi:hypothetical protein
MVVNMMLRRIPMNMDMIQDLDLRFTLYSNMVALFALPVPNPTLPNLRGYKPNTLSRVSIGRNRFVIPSGKVFTTSESETEIVFDLERKE